MVGWRWRSWITHEGGGKKKSQALTERVMDKAVDFSEGFADRGVRHVSVKFSRTFSGKKKKGKRKSFSLRKIVCGYSCRGCSVP